MRILGGRRAWEDGLDAVLRQRPCRSWSLGGEHAPDAELMELLDGPRGRRADAHNYLAEGGPDNLAQLHHFLSDTVLLTGHGFEPPAAHPHLGRAGACRASRDGPAVAVLYYRAQHLAGNTGYSRRSATRSRPPAARPLPLYCASLRTAEPELLDSCARPTRWW